MYIELHRTFHELAQAKGPRSDDRPLLITGKTFTSDDLLQEHRVVVLSAAGAGKTEEILEAAKRLRRQGKSAFFLRLEHVATDFESAFDVGTYDNFQSWLSSTDPGWLLLDSVDESRLKGPGDFELAIRTLSRQLAGAKQRVHLLITSRPSAWRPVTDRALCESQFPYSASTLATGGATEGNDAAVFQSKQRPSTDENSAFKIVSLDDLSRGQVELFARGRNVADPSAFLDAVERADAWPFTAKPLDLEELIAFWTDAQAGGIGSRLAVMTNSIERRLKEHDPKRSEARPLTIDQALEGAMLVAAAATLTKEQTIRVPDPKNSLHGIDVEALLTGWDARQCAALLSRPVFDKAIYGCVRFHHRAVREFLAAQWFAGLLKQETSRRTIEQLFFRAPYGLEVVAPTLRPLLPWLAIFDAKILERVRQVAPEILFEGGDPSQLPTDVRRSILRLACDQLANGTSRRSMADLDAIQRFAAVDLTDELKSLMVRYATNEDVLCFLLRMVWQGRLTGVREEVTSIAGSAGQGRFARVTACRALGEIGSADNLAQIRRAFASEEGTLDRRLLAELLSHTEPSREVIEWLFDCLRRVEDLQPHDVDPLCDEVPAFVERVDASQLPIVADGLNALLNTSPISERWHGEVSNKFRWLGRAAAAAVARMLATRDENALRASALSILRRIPIAVQHDPSGFDHSKLGLDVLVKQWSVLKWALFWHIVDHERHGLCAERGERLTHWTAIRPWESFIAFDASDFAHAVCEINERALLDDRLVALTLAFDLYVEAGRLKAHRTLLHRAADQDAQLVKRLKELLRPPAQSSQSAKFKRQTAAWQRKMEEQQQREQLSREEWRRYFVENVDRVRDPGFDDPEAISRGQNYLLDCLRKAGGSSLSTWSHVDWQSLAGEFGPEVARAFRDGAVAYWRRYRPQLVSEGAPTNSTTLSTVFGLTGLAIEAKERTEWPQSLTETEVDCAFRYAMHELNGFPAWFNNLFAAHGELVTRLALQEISYELDQVNGDHGSQYLLYDIAWSGDTLWDGIAPGLVGLLVGRNPRSAKDLGYALDVIQSSNYPDSKLEELAAEKVAALSDPVHAAYWLAAWTGVAPESAINSLERRLAQLTQITERTQVAMTYVTRLMGSRRGPQTRVRAAFHTPRHLRRLYLLIHEHVRREDDFNRANCGVYSPELRDEAQDARERLLGALEAIPGKEAFVALQDIAREHPDTTSRSWIGLKAKARAEQDADLSKWSIQQVREFNDRIERTPANHQELFELAVLRLLDLKDSIENGDSSIASTLLTVTKEVDVRKFIGNWCRESSRGRYLVTQEEEFADAKRPDLRWHGNGFDGPVPTELKLLGSWTGPELFERLEVQLGGDYLRDVRSRRGIFLLVRRDREQWVLPGTGRRVGFDCLVNALQDHWQDISSNYPGVDELKVIGIDLTKRAKSVAPTDGRC